MIDHTGIGVAQVDRSATFYDAALGALGLRRVMQLTKNDGADRKPALEDELSEIGSLSKWPSLRHANDNKRRL
jgi:catechol 2,3-dioxygenase-like lactoylglutathione lyase family enzyme